MPRGGGGVPRSAKEANNPILLKVQSLQLSFRPAGVSLGGGGGAKAPPAPPAYAPGLGVLPVCVWGGMLSADTHMHSLPHTQRHTPSHAHTYIHTHGTDKQNKTYGG